MVTLDLPGDDEPGVRDPPLSALGGGGGRKVRLREPGEGRRRRERRDERERPVAPPPPPVGGRGPSRPGTAFAPMQGGYGYVPPGY